MTKIIVDAKWLKTCGHSDLEGVALEVTRERDFGSRGIMYDVLFPNGYGWTVWSLRGVTIIEDAPQSWDKVAVNTTLTPVQDAIKFINSHAGIYAFECAEGLVIKSDCVWPEWCFGETRGDDRIEEELMAFPIYELSTVRGVSLRTIKRHLGY